MTASLPPLHVLIVCTGNSARSQMAEALFNAKSKGRFVAASAGAQPSAQVHPMAVEVLAKAGIDWTGRTPRGLEGLDRQLWDFVITVCDRARESCPIFAGQPVLAHWGMPDPAAVEGSDEVKRAAFRDAFITLNRRIDLLLALPVEQLERMTLQHHTSEIGIA